MSRMGIEFTAYDLQVLGALKVSTREDDRSPAEAAARLKPRVPGQPIIDWPKAHDDTRRSSGSDELQKIDRLLDALEDAIADEYEAVEPEAPSKDSCMAIPVKPFTLKDPSTSIMASYDDGQAVAYVAGIPCYAKWDNYPNGVAEVLTRRGFIPMDLLQIGDVVMGLPLADDEGETESGLPPCGKCEAEAAELPTLFTQLESKWKDEDWRNEVLLSIGYGLALFALIVMNA